MGTGQLLAFPKLSLCSSTTVDLSLLTFFRFLSMTDHDHVSQDSCFFHFSHEGKPLDVSCLRMRCWYSSPVRWRWGKCARHRGWQCIENRAGRTTRARSEPGRSPPARFAP